MPTEVKARVSSAVYRAPPPWNLSIDLPNFLHLGLVQEMSQKIWPQDGNPKFWYGFHVYITIFLEFSNFESLLKQK